MNRGTVDSSVFNPRVPDSTILVLIIRVRIVWTTSIRFADSLESVLRIRDSLESVLRIVWNPESGRFSDILESVLRIVVLIRGG